jgi:cytoskeletal protein CcmA (bactofilin family)
MAREEFTALLGAGTEYQGQLAFKGTVRIDGRFSGNITSDGKLILGKDAKVEAAVSVNELVVHGYLHGTIHVAKRAVLHQTAQVFATVFTPSLVMEEGAVLQGDLQMLKEEKHSVGENIIESLQRNEGKANQVADELIAQ